MHEDISHGQNKTHFSYLHHCANFQLFLTWIFSIKLTYHQSRNWRGTKLANQLIQSLFRRKLNINFLANMTKNMYSNAGSTWQFLCNKHSHLEALFAVLDWENVQKFQAPKNRNSGTYLVTHTHTHSAWYQKYIIQTQLFICDVTFTLLLHCHNLHQVLATECAPLRPISKLFILFKNKLVKKITPKTSNKHTPTKMLG